MLAPGQRLQSVAGSLLVGRLAQEPVVERDNGVAPDDDRAGMRATDFTRLAPRVLERNRARVSCGDFLDLRRDPLERESEPAQDLPPLRRARRQEKRLPPQLGKNSPASRAADSPESEP